MQYEVWKLAANCSSFSLSHRSNLMPGSKASQAGDTYGIQVVSCEKTNEKDKRGKLNHTENRKLVPPPFCSCQGQSGSYLRVPLTFSSSNRSKRRHRPPESPSTLNLSPHIHTQSGEHTHRANTHLRLLTVFTSTTP